MNKEDKLKESNDENSPDINIENVNQERRDFLKLTGYACGVACLCYGGYKAVSYMAPAADTMADATIEVDISKLETGKTLVVKWLGKPIFIKNRTAAEIQDARMVELRSLPDNCLCRDEERVKKGKDNILVVVGVCTHLGCIPLDHQGDFNGWFCPCHGSHYDSSGRIRKGPAPTNLLIPPYKFLNDHTILIGVDDKGEHQDDASIDNIAIA